MTSFITFPTHHFPYACDHCGVNGGVAFASKCEAGKEDGAPERQPTEWIDRVKWDHGVLTEYEGQKVPQCAEDTLQLRVRPWPCSAFGMTCEDAGWLDHSMGVLPSGLG